MNNKIESPTISIGEVFQSLRDKGLKCVCSDCDAFGCDFCTVCSMDIEEAYSLLMEIKALEIKYHVEVLVVLPNRRI